MSQTSSNTLELNLNQPSKFQLTFDRVANTVFYCTAIQLPGITLSESVTPNPFTDLYVPGDKITWQPLNLKFILDVNYSGWIDVFQWMGGLGFPQNFEQYRDLANTAIRSPGRPPPLGVRPPYSDAILNIYTNKNNPTLQFHFADCYPIALDSIDLDYGRSADEVVTCGATFRYSYYTIKKL
jgi:hypothetical protein